MADFSSKQYSWCNLSIAFGGRILEGAQELEYTIKREKALLYGRGCKPHELMSGNVSYEGKLKIWQSELEAMIRDAKDKDVTRLRFDIVVTYVPADGGQMVTDILENVEITEVKKGIAQGDTNMVVELPIMFLNLKNQE